MDRNLERVNIQSALLNLAHILQSEIVDGQLDVFSDVVLMAVCSGLCLS